MATHWPRTVSDPVSKMLVPHWYGSVASVFGSPVIESDADLEGLDIAFLGIPWQAPQPASRLGAAGAAFAGTVLTPQNFRVNSLKYGGYLPELDIDVFDHFSLGDYGNADIVADPNATLAQIERQVGAMLAAGCMPFTIGGNSGVASYPVLKAIAAHAAGPVGVVNLDAHGDNHEETAEQRTDWRRPGWAGTWALRILELDNVDPARYVHVGLRGPRNDKGTIPRFVDRGVPRDQIYTYHEIAAARRADFAITAEQIARSACDGAAKVWLAIDPDVLDISVCPDYGDEPLGITVEEMLLIAQALGRQAGRERFGGISLMAIPPDALTMHWICMYAFLYTLVGLIEHEREG